jgi:hypothetical protein
MLAAHNAYHDRPVPDRANETLPINWITAGLLIRNWISRSKYAGLPALWRGLRPGGIVLTSPDTWLVY